MAKILEFRRVKQDVKKTQKTEVEIDDTEDDISAIINDYSLTPANRRWILENMLMDIDDQLVAYKKELEKAESRLNTLVQAAEKEIASAYSEFNSHVGGMAHAVKRLTRTSTRQTPLNQAASMAANLPDHQTVPQ
jgi:septal ring factor EnvC (AmiA/AmiB activator)